ncbi:MAG: ribonuclease P protein component [Atribacterota bacterium]|nr:ribonuclease P protein component [Atribacterota bacterium]
MTNHTLKKSNEFKKVFLRGKKIISKYAILYIMPKEQECNRFGIIVRKRIGNAVQRNRIKRILREIFYKCDKYSQEKKYDFIIIARSDILKVTFQEIFNELRKIFLYYTEKK